MMRMSAGRKVGLSCLMAGVALSFGFGAAVICSGAENGTGTVFEENNVSVIMDPGAAIRKFKDDEIENGIRFCAVLTNSAYESLESLETETVNVTYGMLVASAEDVAEHGALNEENVFGDNAVYGWENGDSGSGKVLIHNFIYDTLPTGEDYSHAASERIIAGELTDFAADALTDELVGVAYVAYENGGDTQYLFAEDNENSVSMTYAAQVAVEKGLDDAEGHFRQLYIDKVPESDKATTFSVEFLFEGDDGTYTADAAVSSKAYDASVGGMTSLANVPESFSEKPGYIVDTEKNAAETAKTVYANGKRTVQAYYKKAAVTGITAAVKQDAKVPSYTSVEALNPYLTVTAAYEGGTSAEITEFTLAEDASGGSALITGKKGGSYEGQQFMPFSGTVKFTVTAFGKTASVEIPVTPAEDKTVVQNFESENALSADYGYGGSTNWSSARSVSNSGGSVALSPKTNTYSQGDIYSLIDVSTVDTLYYYIYFDSNTFTSTDPEYDKESLPEMVSTTFTHTGLTNWNTTVLSGMGWDVWIPVKATKKAENEETNVIRVSFYNKGNTWGLDIGNEDPTGFTYTAYIDGITTEEPTDLPEITGITAEVKADVAPYTAIDSLGKYLAVKAVYDNDTSAVISDFTLAEVKSGDASALITGKDGGSYGGKLYMPFSGTVKFTVSAIDKTATVDIPVTAPKDSTVVQDFDNADALSADYGYGGMASRNTKFYQSGTAAAMMTTRNQTYSQGAIYCNFDISEVDTLYYYVYFDSGSFTDANGTYSKENLPKISATTLTHTGLTNWDVSAQSEAKWDTWILVKATKKSTNTETNKLTVSFYNKGNTWGLSGSAEANTGFTYSAYLDSITTVDPRGEA